VNAPDEARQPARRLGKVPKGVESCGSRRAKDERSGAKGNIALTVPLLSLRERPAEQGAVTEG